MNHHNMNSQTEEDIRNITRLVDIENKLILELGCGTGRISFAIAEKVHELISIDIDTKAIEEASQKNTHENVTFLVENIENFNLGRKFDLILSIGVGYMYLKDIPNAVKNISHHLKEEGLFLLLCSSPEDEYQRIIDLLVDKNIRTISFYNIFEKILAKYFIFEKRKIEGQWVFSDFEDILLCFERELNEEYHIEMNELHKHELEEYFKNKNSFSFNKDTQVYLCRVQ